MMNGLFKQSFEAKVCKTPRQIIQEQCTILHNITGKKIIGTVKEYEPISLKEKFMKSDSFRLGEVAENSFYYEFYITSFNTPKYKYRILFLEYGLRAYPVRVTLDTDFKKEITIDPNYDNKYTFENEDDFTEFLSELLNTSRFTDIVNTLLGLNP